MPIIVSMGDANPSGSIAHASACWAAYSFAWLSGACGSHSASNSLWMKLMRIPVFALVWLAGLRYAMLRSENSGGPMQQGWAIAIVGGTIATVLGGLILYKVLPQQSTATDVTAAARCASDPTRGRFCCGEGYFAGLKDGKGWCYKIPQR